MLISAAALTSLFRKILRRETQGSLLKAFCRSRMPSRSAQIQPRGPALPRMWAQSGLPYRELITELLELALERPTGLR